MGAQVTAEVPDATVCGWPPGAQELGWGNDIFIGPI